MWYDSIMKHPVVQQAVQLGVKGRLVLPAGVRKALQLQEGDRLLLRLRNDGVIELAKAKEVVLGSKGLLQRLYPALKGKTLAQELIQERRREALQE
jgi:AbrB family looped-hinge helix DNA binding protein